MRTHIASVLLCITALIVVTSVIAHDTWLVPAKYRCAPGETITVDIATGMEFPASEAAVAEKRVHSFEAVGGKHKMQLGSFTTADNAFRASLIIPNEDAAGTWVVACSLNPNMIELSAEDFNEYLLHDGLARVHEMREREGLLEDDAIERYTKHAKTLVQVGDSLDDTPTRPFGQTIEIVPVVNPYSLHQGDTLSIKVIYRGKPLAGAEVAWTYPGHGEGFAGSAICDENGQANIPLDAAGPVLMRTIHMERVQQPEYEWESHWASLTFEVQGN